MRWYNSLIFVTVFLNKIIIGEKSTEEDNNVSVDLETPVITGVKLDNEDDEIYANVLKWPLGIIPYYIDTETYDSIISQRIRTAMNLIEGASCVVFKSMDDVPKTNNGPCLHFTNPSQEKECVHEPVIGENGEVTIVLGFECMQRREILHSLLHALGFKDEVSHPHRDQYIRVLWQNLQPKYRPLFQIQLDKYQTKTLVEYDPLSIMHFHDRAFSTNGGATIAPLVPGLVISPSENLSQLDKMKLRLYFGHECNKRKVEDILDRCKDVLRDTPGDHKQKELLHEVGSYDYGGYYNSFEETVPKENESENENNE